eukprot:1236964-Rhodomonas_salina.1
MHASRSHPLSSRSTPLFVVSDCPECRGRKPVHIGCRQHFERFSPPGYHCTEGSSARVRKPRTAPRTIGPVESVACLPRNKSGTRLDLDRRPRALGRIQPGRLRELAIVARPRELVAHVVAGQKSKFNQREAKGLVDAFSDQSTTGSVKGPTSTNL